jgi:nitroreductase
MELSESIKNRRSIRTYKKQDLSDGMVEKLLEAASWAPSAGNVQPWELIVIRSQKAKQALFNAAFGQKDLEESSVAIVVCADEKRAEQSYGQRGEMLYCLQDTAAAIQNILLTTCSLGLASCWMGAFKENEIREVINAPKHMRPVALIPIGVFNEAPPAGSRRSISEIVHKEAF